MSQSDVTDRAAQSDETADGGRSDASTRRNLLVEWSDLNSFQRDLLRTISAADGAPYGLAIKESLGNAYGEEVNHGRMYPSLDQLRDKGYIVKRERDKRTNEYALTSLGAADLAVGADNLDAARGTPRHCDVDVVLESDLYE